MRVNTGCFSSASTLALDASASFRSSSLWTKISVRYCSPTSELPILHQRIDVMPIKGEQFLVGHLARVIDHFHSFRVAGAAGGDLLVTWIGHLATGITRGGRDHTRHLVEIGFRAPEAAARESGDCLPRPRLRAGCKK